MQNDLLKKVPKEKLKEEIKVKAIQKLSLKKGKIFHLIRQQCLLTKSIPKEIEICLEESHLLKVLRNKKSNSREIDKSKPYGFRTIEAENLTTSVRDESSFIAKSLYTEKLLKEYYSNEGCIPKQKIYNALFSPTKQGKLMDKKSQQALTERLLQHKDKVREKNRLNQIQQEIKDTSETQPKEEVHKVAVVKLPEDYNMYDHQMKLEIKRKAKQYDKFIEETNKEKKVMSQAKACPGSQKLIKNSNRVGNVHDNLYEKGSKKMQLRKGVSQNKDNQDELGKESDYTECTFQPKISKKSKQIMAEGKVEDTRFIIKNLNHS